MDVITTQKLHSSGVGTLPAATSATGPLRPGTELPASAVVVGLGEVAPGAAARQQPRTRTLSDVSERRVTIDENTREIVTQTIDARTRELLVQTPDQSLLALRAYFDRLADASTARAASQGDGLEIVRVV